MKHQAIITQQVKKKVFTMVAPNKPFGKLSTFRTDTIKNGIGAGKAVKIITGEAFIPMTQEISVSYPKDWGGEATIDTTGGALKTAQAELERAGYKIAELVAPDRAFAEGRFNKGLSLNERKKMLFNSIDFRHFSFPILFHPKNSGEQSTIQNWIRQIKIDSAPALEGQTFFKFPEYFQLAWPKIDKLFSTGPLVLTNITVNYTPDGVWAQHADGMPIATKVDLDFTEIDLPVRQKIAGENW